MLWVLIRSISVSNHNKWFHAEIMKKNIFILCTSCQVEYIEDGIFLQNYFFESPCICVAG